MKGILAAIVAVPVFALFAGVGILAWRIGDTWSEATTASLVMGLVTVCGGGLVVVALLVSLIVGIPMATRFFFEAGVARRAFDAPSQRGYASDSPYGAPMITQRRAWREEQPPQLTDRQSGSWQSSGPGSYKLWDEEPVEVDRGQW